MGTLIAKCYPTQLFMKLADHTYVECGTGGKAWKCWGGNSGGKVLRQAQGSTKRADKIAQPDEKAGIKCYLINGVCHQAANRILLPAGITVRGAKGYSVSQALFGPYGRIGFWPCSSPFKKYKKTTGDLSQCLAADEAVQSVTSILKRSADDKADWQYIQKALAIYSKGKKLLKTDSLTTADARELHVSLFLNMADFEIGPMLDKKLNSNIRKEREKIDISIEEAQAGINKDRSNFMEYIEAFNDITEKFQDDMANLLSAEAYEALFGLKPDERIVLADPSILKREYSLDFKY